MAATVNEVMTPNPITVDESATLVEVARTMRDADIGPVIVTSGGRACGIVTDRDLVVRGIAEGFDCQSTAVGEICSREMTTVSPNDAIEDTVRLMRDKAVRRVPVVEDGRPVGIVSIGDLALERDPDSALADISAAPPNK